MAPLRNASATAAGLVPIATVTGLVSLLLVGRWAVRDCRVALQISATIAFHRTGPDAVVRASSLEILHFQSGRTSLHCTPGCARLFDSARCDPQQDGGLSHYRERGEDSFAQSSVTLNLGAPCGRTPVQSLGEELPSRLLIEGDFRGRSPARTQKQLPPGRRTHQRPHPSCLSLNVEPDAGPGRSLRVAEGMRQGAHEDIQGRVQPWAAGQAGCSHRLTDLLLMQPPLRVLATDVEPVGRLV